MAFDWTSTLAPPGIVPINGISPLSGNPLLDPSYVNGDTDTDPFSPLGTGDGSWYHCSTTTSLHRARAWKHRGWRRISVSGNVIMEREALSGTSPPPYELLAPFSFSDFIEMEEVPAAVSWADWVITDGPVPPPVREFAGAFGNPTGTEPFGVNYIGNVNTRASADQDLDWRSPSEGGWVEISRASASTGQPAWVQLSTTPVTFELVIEVKFWGNSGLLKNSSGEFFSPCRAQIRARWECVEFPENPPFASEEDSEVLDYRYPITVEADSLYPPPGPAGAIYTDSGACTLTGGTGTNADVQFDDLPLFTSLGNVVSFSPDVYLNPRFTSLDYVLDTPFFWTPPA